MTVEAVIFGIAILLITIYREALFREKKENNLQIYDLGKWSLLKKKSWLIFLDFPYLKIYKELSTWEKKELEITKILCQKKISRKNIWTEAIPVVAVMMSCSSIFVSIFGVILNGIAEKQVIVETVAESGLDEYIMILFLLSGIAIVLWFISAVEYLFTNRYKALMYICESLLESKGNEFQQIR